MPVRAQVTMIIAVLLCLFCTAGLYFLLRPSAPPTLGSLSGTDQTVDAPLGSSRGIRCSLHHPGLPPRGLIAPRLDSSNNADAQTLLEAHLHGIGKLSGDEVILTLAPLDPQVVPSRAAVPGHAVNPLIAPQETKPALAAHNGRDPVWAVVTRSKATGALLSYHYMPCSDTLLSQREY